MSLLATEARVALTLRLLGGLSVDANGVVWVQGSENGGEEIGHALVELELVERFDPEKKLLSTVKIEEEGELGQFNFFCPTAGIAIDAEGRTLYANHERLSLEIGECAPAQEEFNKEEKNGHHATVSSVTAQLAVTGEPPTAAEPKILALDREYTTGIAVDQSKGQPSSGDVYLDNQSSVAAFDSKGDFIQRFGSGQLATSAGGAGIAVNASTIPGITKCCQVPVPEIGRTPSCRPRTIIRIRASQKLGTACPTIVNRVTLRSTQVFSRSAARMPSGIEMTNARLRPTRPSVTVIGRRFWIRFATLSLKK